MHNDNFRQYIETDQKFQGNYILNFDEDDISDSSSIFNEIRKNCASNYECQLIEYENNETDLIRRFLEDDEPSFCDR